MDEEFLRTGEIGFQRAAYGVLGRSGSDSVSPFHFRGASASPPTTATMPTTSGSHSILAEMATGPDGEPVTRPLRQVVLQTEAGVACVPLSRGWSTDQLRMAVQERRLEGAKPIEVYLDSDEDARASEDYLRTMLRPIFGPFAVDVFRTGTVVDKDITVRPASATISRAYTRGVAKVAFHYFLWVSNIFRGDEDCFAAVREFISRGTGDADAIVSFGQPPFIPGLDEESRVATLSHVFLSRLDAEEVAVSLHFFLGPLLKTPLSTKVTLVRVPPLLFTETQVATCHQAKYDEVEGHDGELVVVDAWVPRVVPGV